MTVRIFVRTAVKMELGWVSRLERFGGLWGDGVKHEIPRRWSRESILGPVQSLAPVYYLDLLNRWAPGLAEAQPKMQAADVRGKKNLAEVSELL